MNDILFVSIHKRGDGVNLFYYGVKASCLPRRKTYGGNVGVTPLILNLGTRWAEKNKEDIFNASKPRKEFYVR